MVERRDFIGRFHWLVGWLPSAISLVGIFGKLVGGRDFSVWSVCLGVSKRNLLGRSRGLVDFIGRSGW